MTTWGEQLNPSSVLSEYPRPSMVRPGWWQSLNGYWEYAIAPADAPKPGKWEGRILVPFAVESALSGVGRTLKEGDALWYNTAFRVNDGHRDGRVP